MIWRALAAASLLAAVGACVDTSPPAQLLDCPDPSCNGPGREAGTGAADAAGSAPDAPGAPDASSTPDTPLSPGSRPDAPALDPPDGPVPDTRSPDTGAPPTPGADGTACTAAGGCASGFCVGNVCCRTDCPAEAISGCGRDGTCDATGRCRLYPRGTTCQAARCEQGTASEARSCDGLGTCQVAVTRSCAPYDCSGGGCAASCVASRDCTAGAYCLRARCESLASGLVGWWKLDEGQGTRAADSSGSGAHGTLVSGATWVTPGFPGSAAPNPAAGGFDGAAARIEIAHHPAMSFTAAQSFTVAAWVRWNGGRAGQWRGIVAKSRDQLPHYGLWGSMINHWACAGHDGTVFYSVEGTSSMVPDRWTHVACVQSGGMRSVYVNGRFESAGMGAAATGGGQLWIGGARSVQEAFPGAVDDVRIYNRALGADDLEALAAGR